MSISIKKVALLLPFVLVIAVLPLMGFAQSETPQPIITDVGGVYTLLNNVLAVIYTIFFIIAAIFIVLAAFSYLTAGGDDEKVKSAKQKLIYAIVAIAVALLALSISPIVRNIVGANPGT